MSAHTNVDGSGRIMEELKPKVGWSWWTSIRLWFVKPITAIDGDCFVQSKILDGKMYIIGRGYARAKE